MSKATRFRFASRSAQLSSGMERIRPAKDHCDRTLDSFAASWDERCFRSSTAYFTTSGFQLAAGMDSLRSMKILPVHKMQSSAATLLRRSDNVLDIAQASCARSNRALGFVNRHRVHLLMKGLCRTANSCKPDLIAGAVRGTCNGLCTAANSILSKKIPAAFCCA